jgi:predicted PurR-regulated permease PerM
MDVVLFSCLRCRKALSLISPDGEHAHIYMHVQGNLGALLLGADRPTEAITEFQAALTLGQNLEQQLQQTIQQLTTKNKKKGQKKQQQQQGLSELQQELQEVQQQLGGTLFNLGKALTSVGR